MESSSKQFAVLFNHERTVTTVLSTVMLLTMVDEVVELAPRLVPLTKNSCHAPPVAVKVTSPPSQTVSFGASELKIVVGIASILKKILLLVLPHPFVK